MNSTHSNMIGTYAKNTFVQIQNHCNGQGLLAWAQLQARARLDTGMPNLVLSLEEDGRVQDQPAAHSMPDMPRADRAGTIHEYPARPSARERSYGSLASSTPGCHSCTETSLERRKSLFMVLL
jgi:hypothetical protein